MRIGFPFSHYIIFEDYNYEGKIYNKINFLDFISVVLVGTFDSMKKLSTRVNLLPS